MQRHYKYWPKRVPHRITIPATSAWFNLKTSAARYPDKTAISFLGRKTTYQELAERVDALAGALHAFGVERGDRVLLDMQNTPQLIIAHFAILRANAVVVPVNPMNRGEELRHYIVDSDARVALTTGELAAELARVSNTLPEAQRLRHLVVTQYTDAFDADMPGPEAPGPQWQEWLATRHPLPSLDGGNVTAWTDALAAGHRPPEHVVAANDMALLPYTSGTTGMPKGCIHNHSALVHNAAASALWTQGHSETVALVVVPMFHITGIVSILHTLIYTGATMVLMPRWDRELAGRLISVHKVTAWTNIPTMVVDLLGSPNLASFDLSSLQLMGGGGAAMPEAIAQRLEERYGLRYMEGYGLTETAAGSHINPVDRPKRQCLGIPFVGTESRVVDPQTLAEKPVGESGEILIAGPGVCQGYWKRPDADAAAFVELDGKRFLRTGDIGRVDEDGYFFMTDRLKRMINASGFKVWPAEVEMLMYKHPAVQEVCIIGTKDAYRGESVKAVVVLRADHPDTTAEDITSWCRENMAAYKVPHAVEFVPSLPKTGSGKIMWRILQDKEAAATPAD